MKLYDKVIQLNPNDDAARITKVVIMLKLMDYFYKNIVNMKRQSNYLKNSSNFSSKEIISYQNIMMMLLNS